jgi:ATP-binding cassette subfamily B multidrug efflux pump
VKSEKSAADVDILKRVSKYLNPYRRILYISIFLTILMAGIAPAMPVLVEYTLDNYILVGNYEGLTWMLLVMLGLLLLQTVVRYFHSLMTNTLGQSVIRDLRVDVFNHIIKLRLQHAYRSINHTYGFGFGDDSEYLF